MTPIITGLDHDHVHAGTPDALERMLKECITDTLALVSRINREHMDLAHAILRMQSSADPSRRCLGHQRNVDVLRFVVKRLGEIVMLTFPPTSRVERFVDEAGNVGLEQWEDRLPRANRQIQQCVTMRRPVCDDLRCSIHEHSVADGRRTCAAGFY